MATKSIRPTTRETSALVREGKLRPVVVTVHGSLLEFRAKGLRKKEVLEVGWCYLTAVKIRVAQERAERRKAKQGGKK